MTMMTRFTTTTALSAILALGAAPVLANSHMDNEAGVVFSEDPAVNETTDSLQGDATGTDETAEAPASDPALGYKDADTAESGSSDASDDTMDTETAETGEGDASGDMMVAGSAYGEEILQAFVEAAVAVGETRVLYAERIAEVETQEAAEALVVAAREEMMKVVQETEAITLEEYIEIGTAAQTNPELADWITAEIRKQIPENATPEGGEQNDG